MSLQARQDLVNSKQIIFRSESQRDDIVSLNGVQTELIEMLTYLVDHGAMFEVTAIKSDHSDDSHDSMPPEYAGTHAHGWAIDCWPLHTPTEGAYLDAEEPGFQHFLRLIEQYPNLRQIGLGGEADIAINRIAAGSTYFADGYYDEAGVWQSQDHVHASCNP